MEFGKIMKLAVVTVAALTMLFSSVSAASVEVESSERTLTGWQKLHHSQIKNCGDHSAFDMDKTKGSKCTWECPLFNVASEQIYKQLWRGVTCDNRSDSVKIAAWEQDYLDLMTAYTCDLEPDALGIRRLCLSSALAIEMTHKVAKHCERDLWNKFGAKTFIPVEETKGVLSCAEDVTYPFDDEKDLKKLLDGEEMKFEADPSDPTYSKLLDLHDFFAASVVSGYERGQEIQRRIFLAEEEIKALQDEHRSLMPYCQYWDYCNGSTIGGYGEVDILSDSCGNNYDIARDCSLTRIEPPQCHYTDYCNPSQTISGNVGDQFTDSCEVTYEIVSSCRLRTISYGQYDCWYTDHCSKRLISANVGNRFKDDCGNVYLVRAGCGLQRDPTTLCRYYDACITSNILVGPIGGYIHDTCGNSFLILDQCLLRYVN